MIQNKIVVRYCDGRLLKGMTSDFFSNKEFFHLLPMDALSGSKPLELHIGDLKAVFFVKGFDGNPNYDDKKEFDPAKAAVGRKLKVTFKDGEIMVGTTNGYQPNRPGFFVVPADPNSNVERCFVITSATQEVSFI
jgi:hypothetical protein